MSCQALVACRAVVERRWETSFIVNNERFFDPFDCAQGRLILGMTIAGVSVLGLQFDRPFENKLRRAGQRNFMKVVAVAIKSDS